MTPCGTCGRPIGEDFAFCPYCGAPSVTATPTREQRKRVTILFCDVTGSTALGESTDPEALRALLARYFERMKGIVESHGGTVEKFIPALYRPGHRRRRQVAAGKGVPGWIGARPDRARPLSLLWGGDHLLAGG